MLPTKQTDSAQPIGSIRGAIPGASSIVTNSSQLAAAKADPGIPLVVAAKQVTAIMTVAMAVTGLASPTAFAANASEYSKPYAAPGLNYIFPGAYAKARAEMNEYRHLKAGWDGHGSVAPLDGVIDAAQAFLASLPSGIPSPDASASADGSVEWFWRTSRVSASVLFPAKGRMVYFAKSKTGLAPAKGAPDFDRGPLPQDLVEILTLA